MKAIQVFCGSSSGNKATFQEAAVALGNLFVEKEIDLVYGAGNVGLMGIIANTMLEKGGHVIGVIPHFLMKKEVGHTGISELIQVESMHIRKVEMYQRSEGTIVLPGGYGTLDELFEMLTLVQLGQQTHPIGILNINGYFNHMLAQLDHMVAEEFLKPFHRALVIAEEDPSLLLQKMETFEIPQVKGKWWD